jgi:hypothetical protein
MAAWRPIMMAMTTAFTKYGRHILRGRDALLYVGEATQQTFAARFQQHQSWLPHEGPVRVYVGRMYVPRRHNASLMVGQGGERIFCWRSES